VSAIRDRVFGDVGARGLTFQRSRGVVVAASAETRPKLLKLWWRRRESNPRKPPVDTRACPLFRGFGSRPVTLDPADSRGLWQRRGSAS